MRRWMWLLLVIGLAGAPLGAQDEDDEPEIEIGEDPGKTEPVDKTKPKPKPEAEKPRPVPPDHPPVRGPRDDEGEPATIEEINAAIDKGVAWLKQRQGDDGSWGPCVAGRHYRTGETGKFECYSIGPTAFSIFTLRKCGVPRKDKVIKAGLKWLEERARDAAYTRNDKGYHYSSYEASAIIMMLVALNEKDLPPGKKKDEKQHRFSSSPSRPPPGVHFKRDEWKWLDDRVRHLIQDGLQHLPFQNAGGGWRYWRASGDQDLSATQFALLGLRAASEVGYPVHEIAAETWADAAKCAGMLQDSAGGFHYQGKAPPTLGMTTAGIASLLICKEQMQLVEQQVPADLDERVERGLKYLGEHLDFTRNAWPGMDDAKERPHGVGYHYYYLYGIERVGALSGKKEIGGKAWYPRGATFLVRNQQGDGKWVDGTCMDPEDVLGTCFALLFLKKATPPAVTISR